MKSKEKIISLAPGRVCLFGDHQDYLELPIIACAFNRYIQLVATENDTEQFYIDKPDIGEKQIINIHHQVSEVKKEDFLSSSLKVLRKYNCIPHKGFDITISGNLAINAGTSSSSALTVAWNQFLLEAFGSTTKITPEFVAQVAYEAEVLEMNSSGGKMDQYTIGVGDIIYLETDANSYYEKIGDKLPGMIVAESGISKPTTQVLKELKENALTAIKQVQKRVPNFNLKMADKKDIPLYSQHLPKNLQPYFYAAIANHLVTKQALEEFKKPKLNMELIGELMLKHHTILKNCLNITVPKIDAMIDAALSAGAYGAKIVGSGRGGCIVALAPKGKEEDIVKKINEAGAVKSYMVKVDKGARIVKEPHLIK